MVYVQVACEECLQSGLVLGDYLAGDLIGLELAEVLLIGVAVPVIVSFEGQLLVSLKVGQLVGAVAYVGCYSGAVVGSDGGNVITVSGNLSAISSEVLLAGLVQILLNQPSGGQVVRNVECGLLDCLLNDQNDGVIVNLQATNLIPSGLGSNLCNVEVLALVAGINLTVCQVGLVQVLSGNPSLCLALSYSRLYQRERNR